MILSLCSFNSVYGLVILFVFQEYLWIYDVDNDNGNDYFLLAFNNKYQ